LAPVAKAPALTASRQTPAPVVTQQQQQQQLLLQQQQQLLLLQQQELSSEQDTQPVPLPTRQSSGPTPAKQEESPVVYGFEPAAGTPVAPPPKSAPVAQVARMVLTLDQIKVGSIALWGEFLALDAQV
jgi:hypothetical protein